MQASESGVPGDPSQQLMQPRLDRAGITWLLVVVAGLCWWAAFPPLDVWPLVVISALAVIRAATGARSTLLLLLSAWVVFTLVWLWVQRWTMSVSAPGYPVFAVYLGFYTVLSAWMFRRFGRDPVIGGWPMAIVAPLVIVAVECLRGLVVFGGYPWYYSGHPLIHWPLLVQAADLVGSWWGSILVFSVAGLLFDLLSQERRSTGSLITVCLLLGGSIGYGAWRLGQHDVFVDGPRIVAIQTNLPQDNKVGWSWAAQQQDVPRFIEMTRQAVEAEQPDLVVWPETMIPGLGFESSTTEFIKAAGGGFDYLVHWPQSITAISRLLDVPMLVGSPTWLDLELVQGDGTRRLEAMRRYNSAVLVVPEGATDRYDKIVLAPFGEYLPYVEHWPWLEDKVMAFGAAGMAFNLNRGDSYDPLELGGVGASPVVLATPICFEDTIAPLCRQLVYPGGVKQADMLVNLSNDGWFGDDEPARMAHAMAARFRCIENRVPLLRTVNTGQTALFDSCGRRVASLPIQIRGWLPVEPTLDSRSTIYGAYIGDAVAWCMFVLAGVLLVWTWRPIGARRE